MNGVCLDLVPWILSTEETCDIDINGIVISLKVEQCPEYLDWQAKSMSTDARASIDPTSPFLPERDIPWPKTRLSLTKENLEAYSREIGDDSRTAGDSMSTSTTVTMDTTLSSQAREMTRSRQLGSISSTGSPFLTHEDSSNIIEVTDFKPDTSTGHMKLYFQSKKNSRGGEIVKVERADGRLYITFKSHRAVERVLRKTDHIIEGALLSVKRVSPNKIPTTDKSCFLLTGIPTYVQGLDYDLRLYIENCTGILNPQLTYGESPGTVMVKVQSDIEDMDRVNEKFNQKKFKGHCITFEMVFRTNKILVKHIDSDTDDATLNLYFSNPRSKGGEVKDVKLDRQNKTAEIVFENYDDTSRVLDTTHVIKGKTVTVLPFHRSLSISESDHIADVDIVIGHPIYISTDPSKMNFIMSTQVLKEELIMILQDVNATMEWPDDKGDMVQLLPLDDSKEWADSAKVALTTYLQKFKCTLIPVPEGVYLMFLEKLKSMTADDVTIATDQSMFTVTLCGKQNRVDVLELKIKESIKAMEMDLEKARNSTTETKTLSKLNIKQLQMCQFMQKALENHANVRIDVNKESSTVTFEGPSLAVKDAELNMFKTINNTAIGTLQSFPYVAFLKQEGVEQIIHDMFREKQISATYHIEYGDVRCSATNQIHLEQAVDILRRRIIEKKVSSTSVTADEDWKQLIRDIQAEYHVNISGPARSETNNITVVGFREGVDSAVRKLQQFMDERTPVETFIDMKPGEARYVTEVNKDEMKAIQQKHDAIIEQVIKRPKSGVMIYSSPKSKSGVVSCIKDILRRVHHKEHVMTKPGMEHLFASDKGKAFTKFIESEVNCRIDVSYKAIRSGATHEHLNRFESFPTTSSESTLVRLNLDDGRRISVIRGDITKMQVHAIVNAANGNLDHCGGLAKAIVDAGGDAIQQESSDILIRRGCELLEGQSVSTGPGRLKCKRIIHAVGPKWDIDKNDYDKHVSLKKKLLADAVENSLKEAEKWECQSIAIPAISSGIFGFPIDLCIDVILDTIAAYCKHTPPKNVLDISLVDLSQHICGRFRSGIVNRFDKLSVKGLQKPQGDGTNIKDGHASGMQRNRAQKNANPNEISTPEGKVIKLVKGSISKQKVNVIVNTTGQHLDLKTSGGVSKSIAADGGSSIQQELDQLKAKSGIPAEGSVVVTGGGKLACKAVYHVICHAWRDDPIKAGETLNKILEDSMSKADRAGMTSIAFPAIGTGGLGFPGEEVANAMIQQAEAFSKKHPRSTLNDIRLVVYEQDRKTVKAFQDVFSKHMTTLHERKGRKGEPGTVSRGEAGATDIKDRQTSLQHCSDGTVYLTMGNVEVRIAMGDITTETSDCIVNCTDNEFNYGGGVSKAIVEAAGEEVKLELQKNAYSTQGSSGQMLMTSPGKLKCKIIIHMATDPKNMKSNIGRLLKLADQCGMTSLSMPAIGSGGLGKEPKEVAKKILHSIEASPKLTSLRQIRIVIFKPCMLSDFQQAMKDFCSFAPGRAIMRQCRQIKSPYAKDMKPILHKQKVTEQVKTQDIGEVGPLPIEKGVCLDIYAGSESDVNKAVEKLSGYVEKEIIEKIVDDDKVSKLTNGDFQSIQRKAALLQVKVQKVDTGRVCRLRLEGSAEGVMKVHDDVLKLFRRLQEEEQERSEAILLAKNVTWLYWSHDQFEAYEDELTGYIEQAYKQNKPDVFLEVDGKSYQICFHKMQEQDLSDMSTVPIRRDLKEGGILFPTHWTAMQPGEDLKIVPLVSSSDEYKKVESSFRRSMQPNTSTVIKVERVQNQQLYKQIIIKKQTIEHKSKSGINTERSLYHGTSKDVCKVINAHGFNRSYAGKHAAAYGNGCYFAVNANYSAQDRYSPRDDNDVKYIYQCRVLTGEYTRGKSGMIVPPSKYQNDPTNCYDSVVDNVTNPTIFVIFHDAMAYPEYLISFK
ncbi:protein mono-ADP-ribosyltransferase PARP14-like [Glandiceps talaboti]